MKPFALALFCAANVFALVRADDGGGTIEGYWQDTARRILFARDAPAGYVYGRWDTLDPDQTYPSAKEIRKSASGFRLIDLLYDDEERVEVVHATSDTIEFVRTNTWSHCAVHHLCQLEGGADQLFCALETRCPIAGADELVWRGDERYARRVSCERVDKRQAQGIPVRCYRTR